MIGTIEIKCFAANPQKPLPPVFAFKASPSSLRILDVPRRIGNWEITAVKVAASYPDNSIAVAEAVRTGNVWVATFTGCGTSGKTENGIQVIADGTDENGDAVTGYVLGVGDLYILDRDSSIAADDEKWYVRYCEDIPATPTTGDLIIDNGSVKMFDGDNWIVIATDLSSYATKQELNTAIQGVRQDIPTKTSELQNDSDFVDSTALNSALATKQDKLSAPQLSAIDSVVDERKTVVKFIDGTTATYDIYGYFDDGDWVRNASEIKFGTGVKGIGLNVFYNCTNLTKVQLPDTLEEIWFGAFDSCTGLTDIIIPDSVTYMMGNVFYECTNLKTVIIGSGVKTIDSDVFYGCTNLESVVFNGKSKTQIQSMANYPWGISDTSIITTWNEASKEWTNETKQEKLSNVQITAINSVVAGDYVKAAVMTESEYGQITPQADVVYFVTEDSNA